MSDLGVGKYGGDGEPKFGTAAQCIAQLREHLDKLTLWIDRGFHFQANKPLKPMKRARLEAQADAIATAIEILTHNGNFSRERSESLARVRGTAKPAAPAEPEPPAGKIRVCWRNGAGAKYDREQPTEKAARDLAYHLLSENDDYEFAADSGRNRGRNSIVWLERQDPTTKEWRDMNAPETFNPAEEYGAFRIAWRNSPGILHHSGASQGWNEEQATREAEEFANAYGFTGAGATGDTTQPRTVWIEHQDPTTKEWRQW